jgi:hypothetical protein
VAQLARACGADSCEAGSRFGLGGVGRAADVAGRSSAGWLADVQRTCLVGWAGEQGSVHAFEPPTHQYGWVWVLNGKSLLVVRGFLHAQGVPAGWDAGRLVPVMYEQLNDVLLNVLCPPASAAADGLGPSTA